MRLIFAVLALGYCLAGAAGCAKAPPPAGRWEGTYDAADVIVAARLEIDSHGAIYLSAPDALNFPPASDEQRAAMHDRLARGLVNGWGDVAARHYDFDGHVFRKPGGIAPQMEWDSSTKQMTLIVYLERRPGIRIPMHAVADFNADPWAAAS